MPRKSRIRTSVDSILDEYGRELPLYTTFTAVLKDLLEQLLDAHSIQVHSVTARVKSRESLEGKLSRPSKKYGSLSDVTDLCGIRIITYFEDVVDQVAALLENEFCIDRENSIDKRAALDPDRFGYLSLHHVISISSPRGNLTEYRKFAGYKAEIQTRSILQHAWAEIEHDLGYKTKSGVPAQVRRRFARLAGLLELADKEFTGIREQLEEYEESIVDRIEKRPDLVAIDKISLAALINNSPTVKRLDEAISVFAGAELHQDGRNLELDVERIADLGIETIAELVKLINEKADAILNFARLWFSPGVYGGSPHKLLYRGVSLFYFWYVMLASLMTPEQVQDILTRRRIVNSKTLSQTTADEIFDTYRQAMENLNQPGKALNSSPAADV